MNYYQHEASSFTPGVHRQIKFICSGRDRHSGVEIGKVIEDDDPDPRLRFRIVGTGSRTSKSSGRRVTVVRNGLTFDDHGVIHAECRRCGREVRLSAATMARLFDASDSDVNISSIS